MLRAYLARITIADVSGVPFVADRASWIRRRIPKPIFALGLKPEQTQELIGFCHAVEYLGTISESWKPTSENL
jgi:hypothetical protein